MRFSIDVGDPLKHKKALGVMVDAPLSENTSRIGLNYKLDPGIFSVSLIQRLRAITSLMKDPEVDIEAFGLDDENVRRMIEAGEAMSDLVDAYYDREILLRRYGQERDNTVHGGGVG